MEYNYFQWCVSFCCTAKLISSTYIPFCGFPSHLGHQRALSRVPCSLCVNTQYLFFSFWLTSLCMTVSRSIHAGFCQELSWIYQDNHMVFLNYLLILFIILVDFSILKKPCTPGINPTWSWHMTFLTLLNSFTIYSSF